MALLQPTVYTPPTHEQVSARSSNAVIARSKLSSWQINKETNRMAQRAPASSVSYFRRTDPTSTVSPIEDDFPTPRAVDARKPPSSMSDDHVSPLDEKPNNARSPFFDDMYDATDDEIDRDEPLEIDVIPPEDEDTPPIIVRRPSTRSAHNPIRSDSLDPTIPRNRYPAIAIPKNGRWPGFHEMKMNSSPIPPTPPPKIPISPAILSLLARDAPGSTAPPSLDGSLTSEQLANSTAPPTPSFQTPAADWSRGGIQLHPDALATLNVLPGNDSSLQYEDQIIEGQGIDEQVIETPLGEQVHQIPNYGLRRSSAIRVAPPNRRSLSGMVHVDIPSPSTFFSQLASPSRNTWCPTYAHPLSSSTAEKFYACPWNGPVEQVVEADEDGSDGPPTARPVVLQGTSLAAEPVSEELVAEEPTSRGGSTTERPSEESATSEYEIVEEHIKTPDVGMDFDHQYRQELRHSSMINLDRTSQWLSAQSSYLTALQDLKEEIHTKLDEEPTKPEPEVVDRASIGTKKSVRFSQDLDGQEQGQDRSAAVIKKESAYYRAFQKFCSSSDHADAFMYRQPRSDALHAQRICQPEAHILQLSSHYELKRRSIHEDATPEEKQEVRAAKEREAMDQMSLAMWNVMARTALNQGRLIISPAAKRLAQAGKAPASGTGPKRDRTRILDLGGQPVCDWGWYCARQFPNTKVYTVYTKAANGQLTNPAAIRGPHNHRSVSVPNLSRLPFEDNHFDVIAVRTIYMFLKAKNMVGAPREFDDEYDLCLRECYRCLKPGGYLEFSLLDADIMNAGPLGSAMSVEFSFRLKTRGYDPYPTRSWAGRLQKAGFGNVKRMWMFLPMGVPSIKPNVPSKRDAAGEKSDSSDNNVEEDLQGDTAHVASITGLVGSSAWEKWMLKLHTEVASRGAGPLDGVNAVLEEGKRGGAGWRSLNGWAMKPLK
jgi:SAM-dependent methyltransferase